MPMNRLDYTASCQKLRELGFFEGDDPLPLPERVPQCDDDGTPGVRFFRTCLEASADLSALTLPRTFFGRSEIAGTSFAGTDLSESNLCWNDFIEVDFSQADLQRCDLRSSNFEHCRFAGASLRGADLRHSSFDECDFTDADMAGTIVEKAQKAGLSLSAAQSSVVDWRDDAGPEPDGG